LNCEVDLENSDIPWLVAVLDTITIM